MLWGGREREREKEREKERERYKRERMQTHNLALLTVLMGAF